MQRAHVTALSRSHDVLRLYSWFAIANAHVAALLAGIILVASEDRFPLRLCGLLFGSAVVMWCVVDSMRRRLDFPYSLWWQCLTPLVFVIVPAYLYRSRGRAGIAKALAHSVVLILLALASAFAVVGLQ